MLQDNTNLCLTLGDWQWNASIVGFINIVGEDNIRYEKDSIVFSPEILEHFEEKYFTYFINEYEKTLSWYKIVSFKNIIEGYQSAGFEHLTLKKLENINEYIKDIKNLLKSNSYIKAYELIDLEVDILALEKKLKPLKLPKDEQKFDAERQKIIVQLKETFEVLEQVIAYCESYQGKRYITAKNVIYTVINNGWDGVCFLNPQTKEKDMYVDYHNYFVKPALSYLNEDKEKYKYNCFVCDAPIKDLGNDLSFLNATGFDVARKSSHVWNFQNDIAICPLCKLIYSCLPAGMAYVYNRGLYVNINVDVETAVVVNRKIRWDILRSSQTSVRSIYPTLVSTLQETESSTSKYELADIQVIRYENGSYRFNIFSRKMLQLILKSKEELDSLIKAVLVENKLNIRIYDEVIARIFNNQNLFTLIHRMLYHQLANPGKCYFNSSHIIRALVINQRIYKLLGGVGMKKEAGYGTVEEFLIKNARGSGQKLKNKYIGSEARHKLPGICYRLLNALKTSNKDMFMDVVLNCYLYVKSPVPDVITNALADDKDFSTMGYAFVAGLIDEGEQKENKIR